MKEKTKKKFPVLPALALCLIVLLACYFGITAFQGEQEEAVVVNRMEDIREISWKRDSDTLAFVKEDGTWYVKGNREFPLEQEALKTLSDTLAHLTAVRKLEGHDGLKAYGLLEPLLTVTASDGEEQRAVIEIGNQTGENYYACLEGGTDIYTIQADLAEQTEAGLYDLIVPDEFPVISEEQIEKIEVTKDSVSALYEKTEKGEDGTWTVSTGQETKKADGSRIEELTEAVTELVLGACVDFDPSKEAEKEYGLLTPSIILKVTWTEDGEEKTAELKVGEKKEPEEQYYVMLNASRAVCLADADSLLAFINN